MFLNLAELFSGRTRPGGRPRRQRLPRPPDPAQPLARRGLGRRPAGPRAAGRHRVDGHAVPRRRRHHRRARPAHRRSRRCLAAVRDRLEPDPDGWEPTSFGTAGGRRRRPVLAPPGLRLPDREHRRDRGVRRGGPAARRRRDARPAVPGRGRSWLRATEELFFRDPPLFSIGGTVSEAAPVRPGQPAQRLLADVRPGPAARRPGPRRRGRATRPGRRDVGSGQHRLPGQVDRAAAPGLARPREQREQLRAPTRPTASYVALLCRAIKDMLNDAPARRAAGPRGVRAT